MTHRVADNDVGFGREMRQNAGAPYVVLEQARYLDRFRERESRKRLALANRDAFVRRTSRFRRVVLAAAHAGTRLAAATTGDRLLRRRTTLRRRESSGKLPCNHGRDGGKSFHSTQSIHQGPVLGNRPKRQNRICPQLAGPGFRGGTTVSLGFLRRVGKKRPYTTPSQPGIRFRRFDVSTFEPVSWTPLTQGAALLPMRRLATRSERPCVKGTYWQS